MAEIAGRNDHGSSRRWVPMVLLGALLFVALNAWMALRSVKWLEKSQGWVDHTWQVIAQVERLMSTAKDAETGSRGYLLTGQQRFLKPYEAARRDLPAELAGFKELTADNTSQQVRATQMREVMEHRLALLEQGNLLRSTGGDLDAARAIELMDMGKAEMDRLRGIADAMEGEERRLLVDRTREAETAARRVRYTLALASALDLLLIVFMFRYFVRERELRLTAERTAEDLAVSRVEVERKAAEIQELNEGLERRVQERTAELAVTNRELEATNRELEAFSYSVSHDLRAPLRTIDGFSLALEEDYGALVGAEGKDYIDRVRAGVQRMGGLIDALLQLSRITRAEIERETIDVTTLAESVARQVESQNAGQKIEFLIEKGLSADADAKLLRIALENLFGNAVKFSSKMTESKVEFGWDTAEKAFYIRDNGAGFDVHYKDKLFNAFNRLHGDKDFKGSGIGLATVARVVRRHHGRIWADSVVNAGATFWFTLG
jgi:signal transduction histidine kinase